jgi:cysteine desulfurase/selenocysteine lyase
VNADGTLDMNSLKEELKQKPKIVALAHVSNVLGTVNSIKEITQLAHAAGAKVIVDGAQSVPHIPVDVKDLDCDAFVFSGHKMLGPTGIGAVYVKDAILRTLPPYMGGGGMIKEVTINGSTYKEGPERFEAGTPDIAGAIGLASAVKYLQTLGMDRVAQHDQQLMQYTMKVLAQVPFVKVYGPDALQHVGSVAFNLGDIHAHDVSTVLDEEGVAIRAGHHCAQPLMDRFNVSSMCRVSFSVYTNKEDIDVLVAALQKAIKIFRLDQVTA